MTTSCLLLLLLFSMSVSWATRLGKCCPAGEIFAGRSRVDCVPAPHRAAELYTLGYKGEVGRTEFLGCEKLEDVTTTPLDQIDSWTFLQSSACIEILYEEVTQKSIPIVVNCRSNEDTDASVNEFGVSLPNLIDVKRCCAKNSVFDTRTKLCVAVTDTDFDANYTESDRFVQKLPEEVQSADYLRVTRGFPKCDAVTFIYEVDEENLILENGTLHLKLSLPENDSEIISLEKEDACLELMAGSQSNLKIVVRVCRNLEFCRKNMCIRKCCADGEIFSPSTNCSHFENSGPPIDFYEELTNISEWQQHSSNYGLLHGIPCKHSMYALPRDEWTLTPEGHILVYGDYERSTFGHEEHCMDIFYNTSGYKDAFYPIVCFEDPAVAEKGTITRYKINAVLEVTSCIFLLITLLVYACLPVLQNLHGKTLMCHVASLLLAFICLAVLPWVTPNGFNLDLIQDPDVVPCVIVGYIMLFSFLSAFCWLNVMCFDIWWTFGGLRGNSARGRAQKKKFLMYSLYAWGLPMVMTLVGILSDQMEILPYYYRPNIGLSSCWFTQLPLFHGELLFFVGPVTIQLIANVVFFIFTAMHCSRVKAEISRVIADPTDPRSKRFHADRTKLIMNVKLFIVMGISWIMEIMSFFFAKFTSFRWQEQLFYATDAFNCLQGLLIFILFVLKTRVYTALRRRLGFDEKKKGGSHATTALQDPYRVKKSASSSTLTSTFTVSIAP